MPVNSASHDSIGKSKIEVEIESVDDNHNHNRRVGFDNLKGGRDRPLASEMTSGTAMFINGYDDAMHEKIELNEKDSFTERAVDVPSGFVPSKKEPPKWPGRSASGTLVSQNGSSPDLTTGSIKSDRDRDRSATNRSDEVDGRVRFHSEELRKRREDEERLAREREMLRDSLRGSAKLRALGSTHSRGKTPHVDAVDIGIVNVAYDIDAENDNVQNLVRERSTSRRWKAPAGSGSGFDSHVDVDFDVDAYGGRFDSLAVDRLLLDIQSQLWLSGNGGASVTSLKDELVAVQQLLRRDSTKRVLDTCDLLSQAKRRLNVSEPECPNSAAIADELVDQLVGVNENRSLPQRVRQDASTLAELLSSPIFATLLLAHDKIAGAKLSNPAAFGFAFLESPTDASSKRDLSSRNASVSSQDSRRRPVAGLVTAAAVATLQVDDRDELRRPAEKKPVRAAETDEHVYADAESNPRGFANHAFHDDDDEDDRHALAEPNDAAILRLSESTEVQAVKLTRIADEPLGATIRNEGSGALIIGRILKGGMVERSGLLHEGDELLEINNIDMRGRTVNDAYDIISEMRGTLTFIVAPNKEYAAPSTRKPQFYLRALFEYNAADDPYVPCRELGVEFKRGDVLSVLNDDDPNWWQARIVQQNSRSVPAADDVLPYLIPSPTFYRERERLRRQIAKESQERNKDSSLCSCFRRKKRRKTATFTDLATDVNVPEVLTYDEVTIYYPQPNRKRPIVLVGAEKAGRSELRELLLQSDSDRFARAVPHTNQLRQGNQQDGVDFHFVSRQELDRDAAAGRFIEYGEYGHNVYGTSIESVRTVINSGKVCILALHPESLRVLDETDLKPFVVFVAPPDLERLRAIRAKQSPGQRVTDDELKAIIEKSRQIDLQFGHYFDWAVTFVEPEQAYDELLMEINRLEVEPQYIPIRWMRATSVYGSLPATGEENTRPPTATELSSHDARLYENVRFASAGPSGADT